MTGFDRVLVEHSKFIRSFLFNSEIIQTSTYIFFRGPPRPLAINYLAGLLLSMFFLSAKPTLNCTYHETMCECLRSDFVKALIA